MKPWSRYIIKEGGVKVFLERGDHQKRGGLLTKGGGGGGGIQPLYQLCVSTPVAATRNALVERLQSVHNTVTLLYNRTKEKLGYDRETLKNIVVDEAEKEHKEDQEEEQQENINLTPQEHETALKGAYTGALDHLDYQRQMSTPTSRKSHHT